MSVAGIESVAGVYSLLQTKRLELLGGDKQDILLGQLLEEMKESTKDKFVEIISDKNSLKYQPK